MNTLALEAEPAALGIHVSDEWLTVDLTDSRVLRVPLHWYPRLVEATAAEREHRQLLGGGYAVEWPELDEHIGVEGLLAGRRSGESAASFARWRQARQGAGSVQSDD